VDETDSGSCVMEDFSIGGTESSGCATKLLIIFNTDAK
jgi:hypothetical protein